jgi:serine/threonine protein kinase/tetratricopeptide (TPR) repeat protein
MKLSTEQLARMSRLLDEVVDADDAGREQWLRALAGEHRDLEPALRRALLPADGQAAPDDRLVALPPIGVYADALAASGLRNGDLVGPYRLMRPLGSGGMAEVWLAQRADGAFKREVALKTPSRQPWRQDLAQRFAIERDILAALEHPHIARFYDAGVSQDGRPYLALEYVPGRNLLQWANEHRLGIRERIELFLQVLAAVQYAHDKGVLHRDIKPRNVLVTDAGQVKLLDFGVARLMERPSEADLTKVYGRALTPGYASPEHLQGETTDASSDVYSLGVVLYELVSGQLPAPAAGATIEPARAVQPPSTRLDADAAPARGGSAARIVRAVRGDLDAITLKALAPSASDRYESAQALASDLRRYLAGEPVHAVPASVLYKTRRFLTRNWVGVAQVAAIAAVIAGTGFALLHRSPTIKAAAPEAAVASPTLPALPEDKSIAVLPFADMSEKHDQEYFSDGLSEALIDRLARSPNLRVIARTSAFAFKDRNEDVRSIAAKLGVAYVLSGSVRKSAQVLRISTQLVRAADASHLWSQTYDRDLADIFKVQDEIAGAVADELEAVLNDRQSKRATRPPHVEAYNLVLQGDVYAKGPFERDAERAEVSFKKAIELDPGYALPWVKLALLTMRQAYLSRIPKSESNARARQAIETALRIDPDSMAAHAARFRYSVGVDFQWADARAELDRMRTIDPGDALLLPECEAIFASVAGNLTEAIKIQGQIVARDPLNSSAIGTLAFYLLHGDRFEESALLLQRELQMNPHAIGNHGLIGVDLALLGKGPQALAEIARERHPAYRLWALSIAQWTSGHPDESDAALLELKKSPGSNAYYVAQLYAIRGKKSLAFEWLNKACAERQSGCETLKIDRFFRDLRDDSRFRAVLGRMKLDGERPPATR